MKFIARVLLAFGLLLALPTPSRAQGAPEKAAHDALDLLNAGKNEEAAAAYQKILRDYPTSAVVAEAQFRLAYLDYLTGDFEAGLALLKELIAPPAPTEIQELAASLLPQTLAAKAAKLPAASVERAAAFGEAMKKYDQFLEKFPASDERERIVYGRSVVFYQLEKFDDAAASLRQNLATFAKSESILDSQLLLALTLATQSGRDEKKADALFDEAEKLLRQIVQNRGDVALANEARFQLGEISLRRAAAVEKSKRATWQSKTLEAYRSVLPRKQVIKAQEDRITAALQRLREAGAARDLVELRRLQRLQEREQTRLVSIRAKPDQEIMAKIKIAALYFSQDRFDECRVVLSRYEPLAEDAEQKKWARYYLALSYASQNLSEKAAAAYEKFVADFRADPIADNLPLAIGMMFTNAKIQQPEAALKYFAESAADYPQGRFFRETLAQQAVALVSLKKFEEATSIFQKLLAAEPDRTVAAQAELGLAAIAAQKGEIENAINAFRKVRDAYAGTPAAEQASFNLAGLALQKQDTKTALAELQSFVSKFPESPLRPAALLYLGVAQQGAGDPTGALATYRSLIAKYPADPNADAAYLQIAAMSFSERKFDEAIRAAREFIAKKPASAKLFDAFQMVAQAQVGSGDVKGALATFDEFVEKQSGDPQTPRALAALSQLSLQFALAQGRYLALNEAQRADWEQGVSGALTASERLLQEFPTAPETAQVTPTILAALRLKLGAKMMTDDEVNRYFDDLAEKVDANSRSRLAFAQGAFIFDQYPARALEKMDEAYDAKIVYAPADLDLYGAVLIEQSRFDVAQKIYEKLAADFPVGSSPIAADAQASALYGLGLIRQKQNDVAGAAEKFAQLKRLYRQSPKIVEANFGIAQSLHAQKKFEEAAMLLVQIIRVPTATAELRAKAMLLNAQILEEKNNLEAAIDNYLKVPAFYEGVPAAAAEGLWKGGQLLEKQTAALTDATKKAAQIAKAVKAYRNLCDKYPASPFAADAKTRLAALEK